MKSLKELEKRALFIIVGILIMGVGVVLIISVLATHSKYDKTGNVLGYGLVIAACGVFIIISGFSSKKKFESFTDESPSPEKKEEPQAPQQNEEMNPPPLT